MKVSVVEVLHVVLVLVGSYYRLLTTSKHIGSDGNLDGPFYHTSSSY